MSTYKNLNLLVFLYLLYKKDLAVLNSAIRECYSDF